ncbi:MAG: hypothetical protein ABIG28_01840 [archaeon]
MVILTPRERISKCLEELERKVAGDFSWGDDWDRCALKQNHGDDLLRAKQEISSIYKGSGVEPPEDLLGRLNTYVDDVQRCGGRAEWHEGFNGSLEHGRLRAKWYDPILHQGRKAKYLIPLVLFGVSCVVGEFVYWSTNESRKPFDAYASGETLEFLHDVLEHAKVRYWDSNYIPDLITSTGEKATAIKTAIWGGVSVLGSYLSMEPIFAPIARRGARNRIKRYRERTIKNDITNPFVEFLSMEIEVSSD